MSSAKPVEILQLHLFDLGKGETGSEVENKQSITRWIFAAKIRIIKFVHCNATSVLAILLYKKSSISGLLSTSDQFYPGEYNKNRCGRVVCGPYSHYGRGLDMSVGPKHQ